MNMLPLNSIKKLTFLFFFAFMMFNSEAQKLSPARVWNEVLLDAIRNDFARPTVHARNLHHTSIAMYDAFAVYDDINKPYFLGNTIGDFTCEFEGVPEVDDLFEARKMAMSYAIFRIIEHRFKLSPGADKILEKANIVMSAIGYDTNFTSTDYSTGFPAALGNYLGQKIIEFGMQDGSNEFFDYANKYYVPINPVIDPFDNFYLETSMSGNGRLVDPNRWQKIEFQGFRDQSGNISNTGGPPFLSPEWGNVTPFSLTDDEAVIKSRDGHNYRIYHDPGPPCYLDTLNAELSEEYKWGFSLVAKWRTHTMFDNLTEIDISPGAIGNYTDFPTTIEGLREAYNFEEGGDYSTGHALNPATGQPYEPNFVRRDQYASILAEFWADGPDSETPPGHWFTILNYVNDNPELIKKYKGQGEEMGDFEWDVKSYFILGGAKIEAY